MKIDKIQNNIKNNVSKCVRIFHKDYSGSYSGMGIKLVFILYNAKSEFQNYGVVVILKKKIL